MRNILRMAIAALVVLSVVSEATAQTRGAVRQRNQAPVAPSADNPYGLTNCADRPFARDCDRRGTW